MAIDFKNTDFTINAFNKKNTKKESQIILNYGMLVCEKNCFETDKMLEKYIELSYKRIKQIESIIIEKHKDITLGKSEFKFAEIASRGSQRFDLKFDLNKTKLISDLTIKNAPWIPIIHDLLGTDIHYDTSVIYSRPGATDQNWHCDGPHISKTNDKPYSICVFVPLIDLNKEIGYTQFWPASHKRDMLGLGG